MIRWHSRQTPDSIRRYGNRFEAVRSKDANLDRSAWKTDGFLADQLWDLDELYFDGFFRANGWKDSFIRYSNEDSGALGYFDATSEMMINLRQLPRIDWDNQNTGMCSMHGITINGSYVFRTLNELRNTIAHEMCHACVFKQFTCLDDALRNDKEAGHGYAWKAMARKVGKKSEGIDDLIIERFADETKAAYATSKSIEMASKFCYYYVDGNDDYSNIRVFRTAEPQPGFEDMWDMMHYERDSRAQSKLMLIKASDEFLSALVPRGYEDLMDAFRLRVRGGRVVSSIDQFISLPSARPFMALVRDCQKRDMSYVLNGERVEPCKVIDEWKFEDFSD